MKINKKLAFSALKALPFGDYKTLAKAEFKKVEKATADKPVLFYLNMEHTFAKGKGGDDEDSKGGLAGLLAIFGKPDKEWKAEIKAKTKSQKKLTLAGKCYVETTEKGEKILNAFVAAGDATPDKLFKAGKKLFTTLGIIKVNILGAISEDQLDAPSEEDDTDDSGDEVLEVEESAPVTDEQRLMSLIEQYKSVFASVKPLLTLLVGGKTVADKEKAILEVLTKNIQAFQALYAKVVAETQAKFKSAFDQMDKIFKIISGGGSKEDMAGVTESMKNAEALKKLLDKTDALMKKLNIEALALQG